MARKQSRKKQILRYMEQNGSITGLQAWKLFHVYRLAVVIHRLREEGHDIDTVMVEDIHGEEYGKYAKYVLRKEESNDRQEEDRASE